MTSTGAKTAPHVPVLVSEVIAALAIHEGETVVDGTFGAGGYTRAMLGAGAGRVIGLDRDPDAIAAGPTLGAFHVAVRTPAPVTDPDPANTRAVRAYEKAGFEKAGMVDTPDGPALLMVRNA